MASILQVKQPKSATNGCKILNSKPKLSQKEIQDTIFNSIGLEYDPLLENDRAFIMKILDTKTYLPQNEFIIDFNYEFSKLMELKELRDERSKGTVLGMAVLGVVGFFAFSFTIIGGIAGGVLGIILGRYAGKKIVRKAKSKTMLTEFELFTTKLECLMKWVKLERKKCQFNINNYRFVLEKVLQTFKLAFFQDSIPNKNQKKVLIYLIKKIRKELMTPRNQITLYFSYRLFKSYMKNNNENKEIIANILNNVFVPLYKILTFQKENKENKINLKFDFFAKLHKLLHKEAIVEIIKIYPDSEISENCKTIFLQNLNVKINITKQMLEFFGTNPFLQNLFLNEKENFEMFENRNNDNNQNKKNSSDPILDNLIDSYNNQENHEKHNHLKTIYSEGDSSVFTVNDEDVILEIPKDFVHSNKLHGDKNIRVENKKDFIIEYEKKNHENHENMRILKCSTQAKIVKEEPKPESFQSLIVKSEESKCSIKGDLSMNKSFAMNRRGDEFLKMPSLNVLSEENKHHKNLNKLQTIEGKDDKKSLKPKYQVDDQQPNKTISEESLNKSGKKKSSLSTDIVVENNFTMLVNYVYEDVSTWDKVSKSKFLEVHRRKVPGSPCVLIKAKAILENIHKQMVFDQIYTIDKRKKWDTVFGEFKQIEQIDEVTDVIYFLINSPFGVMNRDFVQKRVYRYNFPEEGTLSIQFKSIDHPMVPVKKNCIRAETFISGYIISAEPLNPENTILQLVTQVDVKGSIPKSIVNYTASKAPIDWVNNLKKACLKNK